MRPGAWYACSNALARVLLAMFLVSLTAQERRTVNQQPNRLQRVALGQTPGFVTGAIDRVSMAGKLTSKIQVDRIEAFRPSVPGGDSEPGIPARESGLPPQRTRRRPRCSWTMHHAPSACVWPLHLLCPSQAHHTALCRIGRVKMRLCSPACLSLSGQKPCRVHVWHRSCGDTVAHPLPAIFRYRYAM